MGDLPSDDKLRFIDLVDIFALMEQAQTPEDDHKSLRQGASIEDIDEYARDAVYGHRRKWRLLDCVEINRAQVKMMPNK